MIIGGKVEGTRKTSARCTATKPTMPAIMKKWMMLLGGWLILFAIVKLVPIIAVYVQVLARLNMKVADIALAVIAIVAGVLVFLDK